MRFYGLQKMTLLDFPGKIACTLFTGGCNLRCPFCHNARLVVRQENTDTIDEDAMLEFLKGRIGLLDGVCITGGEPLINDGLESFILRVKGLGFCVKLDTNGCFPDRLQGILESGYVDYVAMDIKNSPAKYAGTTGIPGFDISPVIKSIDLLKKGSVPYEFRTTVVKEFHSKDDIASIARLIAGAERYFLQDFVDSGDLIGNGLHSVGKETLCQMTEEANRYVPTQTRGI